MPNARGLLHGQGRAYTSPGFTLSHSYRCSRPSEALDLLSPRAMKAWSPGWHWALQHRGNVAASSADGQVERTELHRRRQVVGAAIKGSALSATKPTDSVENAPSLHRFPRSRPEVAWFLLRFQQSLC